MIIIHWNAQSLTKKVNVLEKLLYEQNVDIALISETKLKSSTKLTISGYDVYRKDEISNKGDRRPTAYRGLAVLVRKGIEHTLIDYKPFAFDCFYALGVDIGKADNKILRVYAAYRPPGGRREHFTELTSALRSLLDVSLPVILAGDFNAKHLQWNSTKTCPVGNCLWNDSVSNKYYVVGPSECTHRNDRSKNTDVIDIVVHKGLDATLSQTVLRGFPSDHSPVLLKLSSLY